MEPIPVLQLIVDNTAAGQPGRGGPVAAEGRPTLAVAGPGPGCRGCGEVSPRRAQAWRWAGIIAPAVLAGLIVLGFIRAAAGRGDQADEPAGQ